MIGSLGAACAIGRKDPAGLRPQTETDLERAVATVSPAQVAEPVAKEAPRRTRRVRTIGRCDQEQRSRGYARFTLAHFNDLQARYSERIAGKSRYAYLAGYLDKLKTEVPETIVLDAGDDHEKGSIAELRSMGEATRRMIQALPIDVRTIGNHDFAYGEDAVLRDVTLSAHPVLAANVRHVDLPATEQPLQPFARIDVGCVRVGVIGLVTQNYGADDQPTTEAFDGVFEHDPRYAEVLEREVKAHRDEVDVLVALTHLGFQQDTTLAMSSASRGVDLFVGAHTEELLKDPALAVRRDGTRTWIMQAGHFGQTLGRADLLVNLRERSVSIEHYAVVEVDASLPVSEEVARTAEQVERDFEPDLRAVIGTTRSELRLGREMTDLLWRATTSEWGVDALAVGLDLFWMGLPRGPVTLQRLYDSVVVQKQPAGTSGFSSLWVVDVSGRELASYAKRLRSSKYVWYGPQQIDPKKNYRLAVDKRAMTYPRVLFGDETRLPEARFGGEMIDVLEGYARARSANGETLD